MDARILTLSGTVHPKAEIVSVDAAHGVATFRWLDSSGKAVDSGSSVARFTPVEPLPKAKPGDPDTYPEISDAVLTAAIATPAADPAPVVVLTPLTVISRLTPGELAAIATSTDAAVASWRTMAIAAQEIRSDDPRTADGFALLVSKGILAANRPAELLAP